MGGPLSQGNPPWSMCGTSPCLVNGVLGNVGGTLEVAPLFSGPAKPSARVRIVRQWIESDRLERWSPASTFNARARRSRDVALRQRSTCPSTAGRCTTAAGHVSRDRGTLHQSRGARSHRPRDAAPRLLGACPATAGHCTKAAGHVPTDHGTLHQAAGRVSRDRGTLHQSPGARSHRLRDVAPPSMCACYFPTFTSNDCGTLVIVSGVVRVNTSPSTPTCRRAWRD